MKEDVGMSKPKKHANKVRWDPKLNKPLHTYTTMKQNTKSCTYVEVVCLILGPTEPCSHAFWVLTSLHLLSFLLEMFFIILVDIKELLYCMIIQYAYDLSPWLLLMYCGS